MRYDIVLWDFDGTLVDTSEGIFKSIRAALRTLGIPEPPTAILQKFIGPPLLYGFDTFMGLDFETATRATALFRADYAGGGVYLSRVYDGLEDIIKRLRGEGVKIGVATLKPEHLAKLLLDHFSIAPLIDVCVGTTGDERATTSKAGLIADAIARLGGAAGDRVLLIGDTIYDADGAREAGVDFVGVAYEEGASEGAQKGFGCAYVAESAADLERFFFTEDIKL